MVSDLMNESGVRLAYVFAYAAHSAVSQYRKYTHEPYIVHPHEVASLVAGVPHTLEMLQAAFLHDTVEDTGVQISDIYRHFGKTVAAYVDGLTNVAKPADGNRAARFKINCAHLAVQCREVQTIKIADLISNTSTIVRHDPHFAKMYLEEKRQVLLLLNKGDEELTRRAWLTLKAGITQLEKTS